MDFARRSVHRLAFFHWSSFLLSGLESSSREFSCTRQISRLLNEDHLQYKEDEESVQGNQKHISNAAYYNPNLLCVFLVVANAIFYAFYCQNNDKGKVRLLEQKVNEKADEVVLTDTVIYPWTVMVEALNTSVAPHAMECSRRIN